MIEKALSKDVIAKWTAVILAVLMWFQVGSDRNPLETKVINLDLIVAEPPGTVVVSAGPSKVAVTLMGRVRTLARLNPQEVSVAPDLSEVPLGVLSEIPITFDPQVSGIRVLDVSPKVATVELDAVRSKEVAVTIKSRGAPNQEFVAEKPHFQLASAEITGPGRQIDKVQYVMGEIDVGGATADVKASVSLSARDAAGNEVPRVKVEPSACEVTVFLTKRPPAKVVRVTAHTIGVPKSGYRVEGITVAPDSITLRADPEVIAQIDSISANPVDVTGKDSSFTVTRSLKVPDVLDYIEASQVSIYVKIAEDVIQRPFTRLVIPHNAPPGYKWDVEPREVTVYVNGRRDVVEGISEADIQAYIDAEGRGEGSHRLPVAVGFSDSIAEGVGLDDITPSSVTVTFTKR